MIEKVKSISVLQVEQEMLSSIEKTVIEIQQLVSIFLMKVGDQTFQQSI
jgi:hypothetical protein